MLSNKRSCATLRIFSRTLTSAEITRHLKQVPTESYEIGHAMNKRNAEKSRRKEAFWMLESSLERSEPLAEHIAHVLNFVEEKAIKLDELRSSCQMDIRASFISMNGQGTLSFEPSLLTRLARAQLPLIIDV
jgi:hypothetical protein